MMGDPLEGDTTEFNTDLSTTLSATLDSSRSQSNSKYHLDVTRDQLEKRQLLHSIQLLKLEVAQKQLVIDTLRNEQACQIVELQEQLADAAHEKKLLSLRLQSLSHGYEQELKTIREKLQKEKTKMEREEVAQWSRKPATLEEVKLELEAALMSVPLLTQEEYHHLNSTNSAVSTQDFIRLRFYDLTKQLQTQSTNLQQKVSQLNKQMCVREEELTTLEKDLIQERERTDTLERERSNLIQELGLVKTKVLEGNYKVDNYDTVMRERDQLLLEKEGLQNSLIGVKSKDQITKEELDRLTKELSSIRQSETLLQHDKDYLSRQAIELTQKVQVMEERFEMTMEELTTMKQAKEKLYEQLVNSREEHRMKYDHQLESELEGIKARTALEMEQLRVQTREMYDRESKILSDARDSALTERDRAKSAEKELADKYENLLKEYHRLQASSEKSMAELQGELQMVRFEKERTRLVHQETLKDFRHLQLEQEKLQKKVEMLTREFYNVASEKDVKVRSLEGQLFDAHQRLQGYEKIEKQLDDIVMESAQMEHSCDAERVLFSYGFGTSVPTTSKRRLQQSVHLARRVLQLEKINCSLRNQLKREEEKVDKLQEELESSQDLLKGSQQPHIYLVTRVKEQKTQLKELRAKVANLQKDLAALATEKSVLIETKNQMAADLERLLNHREELHVIKSILLGNEPPQITLGRHSPSPPPLHIAHLSSPNHTSHRSPSPSSKQSPLHPQTSQQQPHPKPTVFTKPQLR